MNEKGSSTLKICQKKFNYLNYSEKTKINYLGYIDKFLKSQTKSAKHLNARYFQCYLDDYDFTSVSKQNQVQQPSTGQVLPKENNPDKSTLAGCHGFGRYHVYSTSTIFESS